MKIPWKNISIFLSGILSGFLLFKHLKKPDQIVYADTYIEDQEQKIGKIKQKGEGHVADIQIIQSPSKKELRQKRKANKRAKRKASN